MTLTNRLSLFFLATLAAVLVTFSAALYLLADLHLHRQLDDRLSASARTLASAAEVESRGVEWEPHSRPLAPPVLLMRQEIPYNWSNTYYVDATGAFHYAGCRAVTGLVADENVACRATFIISGVDGSVLQTLVVRNPASLPRTQQLRLCGTAR